MRVGKADLTWPDCLLASHFVSRHPQQMMRKHGQITSTLYVVPLARVQAAVVPLALGIARALAHLHSKRIVHGDLNPNNVLLKRDPAEPSGYVAKVGDFGLR